MPCWIAVSSPHSRRRHRRRRPTSTCNTLWTTMTGCPSPSPSSTHTGAVATCWRELHTQCRGRVIGSAKICSTSRGHSESGASQDGHFRLPQAHGTVCVHPQSCYVCCRVSWHLGDVVDILRELRWGEVDFGNLRYRNYSQWCAGRCHNTSQVHRSGSEQLAQQVFMTQVSDVCMT
jgi:hypothetical protein